MGVNLVSLIKIISLKYILLFTLLNTFFVLHAQEEQELTQVVDSLYREDQLYLGVSFNLLGEKPSNVIQNRFSGSLQGGFIRDMPINKKRNRAIGLGLGLAGETFSQNIFINNTEGNEETTYELITSDISEDINRFVLYSLELPIEYRWRTSTPTDYSFWRIHAGLKLGYIFSFRSTFEDENNNVSVIVRDVPELNNFQYGLTLSFGYGAFNFHGYYGLNTLFNEDAVINGELVNLQVLRLGIQFFFL